MCVHVALVNGIPKVVAWVGDDQIVPTHNPFSAPQEKKRNRRRGRKKQVTAEQIEKAVKATEAREAELRKIEARLEAELETTPMLGTATRIKTAATAKQLFDRDIRNTTQKTIHRGEVVKSLYPFTRMDGVIVDSYRIDCVRKHIEHDSHGVHGRKPRYKDHQQEALGKSGEMRAKYKHARFFP